MPKFQLTRGGGSPLACQNCLKWLCGDPQPTRYRSHEEFTYGYIYCCPNCIEEHEAQARRDDLKTPA